MRYILALLGFLLIAGCVNRMPENNQSEGLLVLPMFATSPYKNPFTYRYIISLDKSPGEIIVTPNVSQNSVIVEGLAPGTYTMTGITAMGRRNYSAFSSTRMKPKMPMSLEFNIELGAITVLNQGFFVKSNVQKYNERADDTWNFSKIGGDQFQQLVSTLSDRGYLELWSISNNSPNAFRSN